MKKFLLLILVLSLIVSVVGCGPKRAKRLQAPSYDTQAIAKGAMNKYDLNKDGQISADELEKAPSLKNAFPDLTTITSTEIANKVRMWKESRLGLITTGIKLVQGKKAVENADVTVSSEDFMSGEKISFTDKSNIAGVVMLNAPNADNLPGIQCGFYKVDVRYNGKTYNFGLEVGLNTDDTTTFEIPEK